MSSPIGTERLLEVISRLRGGEWEYAGEVSLCGYSYFAFKQKNNDRYVMANYFDDGVSIEECDSYQIMKAGAV